VTIEVSLDVMLKGIDLVADTAFLTLRGKMGFGDNLLGIKRLDSYAFQFDTGNPPVSLARLKRLLNTQTLFYNRNKHHFTLVCDWEGGGLEEGVPRDHPRRQLTRQVLRTTGWTSAENFHGNVDKNRVIFKDVPVFRTEVLVEDLDPAVKLELARKLESELSAAPVAVTALGTRWLLALAVASPDEATELTHAIVVTKRRDQGFLLNPNYQGFRFLAAGMMELEL
jgi:hypothetical protein